MAVTSWPGVDGSTAALKRHTQLHPTPRNGTPFGWAFLAVLDFQIEIMGSTAPGNTLTPSGSDAYRDPHPTGHLNPCHLSPLTP